MTRSTVGSAAGALAAAAIVTYLVMQPPSPTGDLVSTKLTPSTVVDMSKTAKVASVLDRRPTVEIGDSTKAKSDPSFAMSFWGGECKFRVHLPSAQDSMKSFTETSLTLNTKPRKQLSTANVTHDMYFIMDGEGVFEWEAIFPSKPVTNILTFKMESAGLSFYYQTPLLTPVDSGRVESLFVSDTLIGVAFQSHEVVGSYAVYHSSKKHNWLSRSSLGDTILVRKYETGKACHIYRPKLIDDSGAESWCDLTIGAGVLRITLPQKWLDQAKYPVTLDPTIGLENIGGSTYGTSADAVSTVAEDEIYTASAGDTLTELAIYAQAYCTSNMDNQLSIWTVDQSSGTYPESLLFMDTVNVTSTAGEFNITGLTTGLVGTQTYCLTFGNVDGCGIGIRYYYDAGDGSDTSRYGNSLGPTWNNTFTSGNRLYTCWGEVVTGSGGDPEPNRRRKYYTANNAFQRMMTCIAMPLQ